MWKPVGGAFDCQSLLTFWSARQAFEVFASAGIRRGANRGILNSTYTSQIHEGLFTIIGRSGAGMSM
jgi:hypothetical protein